MGKELSPLAVFLILGLFGLLSTPIFLNYQAATEVPRITHMHQAPNGHLHVMLGNELFEFDAALNPYQAHDLTKLGVHSRLGDFAFFSNGDLLIRKGSDDRSFLYNLQRLLRLKNRSPDTSTDNSQGLVRCQLETASCTQFGNPPVNLNDAFHLTIEQGTDRVFLADSSRHAIHIYSQNGGRLEKINSGLKFPNQLVVNNDLLYVANTNRHEIAIYPLESSPLKKDDDRSFRTRGSGLTMNSFPASLLLTDNEIWVVNYSNGMSDGRAIRFSPSGSAIDLLETPENADIFSMVRVGNEVLVSDYQNNKIYHYSNTGEWLGEFTKGPLFQRIAEHDQTRDSHYFWMNTFIALFVLALIIGTAIGIKQSAEGFKLSSKSTVTQQQFSQDTPGIIWLEADPAAKKQTKLLNWAAALVVILLAAFAFFMLSSYTEPPQKEIIGVLSILPIIVLSVLSANRLASQRIGIHKDWIILSAGKNKTSSGYGNAIYYTNQQIGVGNTIVTLKTNKLLFSKEELVAHVRPLLKGASQITKEQMLWMRLNSDPITALLWIVAIGLALFGLLGPKLSLL